MPGIELKHKTTVGIAHCGCPQHCSGSVLGCPCLALREPGNCTTAPLFRSSRVLAPLRGSGTIRDFQVTPRSPDRRILQACANEQPTLLGQQLRMIQNVRSWGRGDKESGQHRPRDLNRQKDDFHCVVIMTSPAILQ